MISLVINCDSRPGADAEVCEHGHACLAGVHSYDFLTDGVRNKVAFFKGYELETILYIDEHETLPTAIQEELAGMVSAGIIQKLVCKPHDRTSKYWNDLIYIEALKLASGNYVAHFDCDSAAFRSDNSHVVMSMLATIFSARRTFVCYPVTEQEPEMFWASTRFFFCTGDWIRSHLAAAEMASLDDSYRSTFGHVPCLEHVFGRMAGEDKVLYPRANWNEYMIFSWAHYHKGLLAKLNAMPYEQVRDYILDCGIYGANDVTAKPI